MTPDENALRETLSASTDYLLAEFAGAGRWEGELSSSALATATAVFALWLADERVHRPIIQAGLRWLRQNTNDDGGWGDTVRSKSNLSTTLLVWSALTLTEGDNAFADTVHRADDWLDRRTGGLSPPRICQAVTNRYGSDRTFAVPILTMCAIAGRLGADERAWRSVPQLPFELAALPHGLWKRARLSVVSYALPALIAIGLVRHRRCPSRNPLPRLLRNLASTRTLKLLERIQPDGGGFLEAPPLTAFVTMSLIAAGCGDHPAVAKGVNFLQSSARDDGSWPIDTNLATWLTTASVDALAAGGSERVSDLPDRQDIRRWLLDQQHLSIHPYTHAAPGGWSWTDLPGGVPDADDTAGALIALRNLGSLDECTIAAAMLGAGWLVDLQNSDGGIPTFSRGWGALAFDRSSPDITAHALRALKAWEGEMPPQLRRRATGAMGRAIAYLSATQSHDGAWAPLWFANQHAPGEQNLTYGTAKVLSGLCEQSQSRPDVREMIAASVTWLLSSQNDDRGWGGAPSVASSIEETALAVASLAGVVKAAAVPDGISTEHVHSAAMDGAGWLIEHTNRGTVFEAAPIGLYFARLWYFERLYPVIFTVAALRRVSQL